MSLEATGDVYLINVIKICVSGNFQHMFILVDTKASSLKGLLMTSTAVAIPSYLSGSTYFFVV